MNHMIAAAILLLGVTPALAVDPPQLPNRSKTPGVAATGVPNEEKTTECLTDLMGHAVHAGDPLTQEMLCHPNYTKCVRSVSAEEKKQVYENYDLPGGDNTGYCSGPQGCEVDHLISLELGGSNDVKNLWPQAYHGLEWNAHVKDHLENKLKEMVCKEHFPLAEAQKEVSTNWIEAFKKHISQTPTTK
jgi:hypothetical protein